ncbi:TPM domain-containing protein [Corynebacterium godavarianum]|uniref:TPM domain-containing protein n=1 Tax=Corynebacterium godavarianum TaxID=2054421 RepID=A0ABY3E4F0_9CORY|nr:TPM domain-containing protein [Corynebacterium godavarianum]MBL7286428.1 TPM domain-containing protein [Corynebacterium godavarianum]TSJ74467.1 TPM domain-containing protein [Corynebacterium godavarianum]
MNSRYLRIVATAPLIAGALLIDAPMTAAHATPPTPDAPAVLAQAVDTATAPGKLAQPVTDEAGVLSEAELASVKDAVTKVSQEKHLSLRVVYASSLGTLTGPQWAEQAVAANGANTAVLVVAPDERAYGVFGGNDWTQKDIDAMDAAAYEKLSAKDWAGVGTAAAEAAISGKGGSGSGGSDGGSGAGWAAGGVGVLALAGGGAYVASRRNTKKQNAKQLESAKALTPGDTDSLGRLPTPTLEQVARDALVAADESITQGKEELQVASAEFGAERVRPFTSAMNQATSTLQRAFHTHQKLYDAIPETEPEKRAMLIDIISSCGKAEEALKAKTDEFNAMRGTLMRADEEVNTLRARTIDIRARIEPAKATLEELRSRHNEGMLHSIDENVDVAESSLAEAEKQLSEASALAAKPAGQQGALIDVLATATQAVKVADTNLAAIEHAEDNLAKAQHNLPALIKEIEGELREIDQVKGSTQQGARIDVASLDAIAAQAREALSQMGDRAETDPLALYTELTDLDGRIDAELDRAKGVANDQSRALQLFTQQMQVATTQIQSAEDLIRSRGRIIGSHPRSLLAESQRQYAEAHQRRTSDTRGAIDFARAATDTARRAYQAAKDDVDHYRSQQNRQTAGDIARAAMWGAILSGGFGGGGGGGGFSGGGGGGNISRGGTF